MYIIKTITPCASITAIGSTIDYITIEYSASNGIGGVTEGNLYVFWLLEFFIDSSALDEFTY